MKAYGIGVSSPHVVITVMADGIESVFSFHRREEREELARAGVRRALQHAASHEYRRVSVSVPPDIRTAGLALRQTPAFQRIHDLTMSASGDLQANIASGIAVTAGELFAGGMATPPTDAVDRCAQAADELLLITDASHVPDEANVESGTGCGVLLATPEGILLDCAALQLSAETSMEAEIRGMYRGLACAASRTTDRVHIFCDQRRLVEAFNGQTEFSSTLLQRLVNKCESAFYEFTDVQAEHVSRRAVEAADRLARVGVLRQLSLRDNEFEGTITTSSTKYSTA